MHVIRLGIRDAGKVSRMRVCEIFQSWQGEFPAGMPCLFVRLQGCTQRCAWCDTKYAWNPEGGFEVPWQMVARLCRQYEGPVVFTGGEPLMQVKELKKVVRKLPRSQPVYIETNGEVRVGGWLRRRATLVVSPKSERVLEKWARCSDVVVKLVVDTEDAEDVMRKTQLAERVRGIALLMPLSGQGRNPLEQCAKLVMHLRTRTRGVGFVMRMQEVFGFR